MSDRAVKFWRLGLVGYPLGHSLSPLLHTAALDALGLSGEYNLHPISPDDISQLQTLLGRMRDGSLHGLNLTIPHKQSVLPFLDELTPISTGIGAVNTIYARDDHLIGDNTDAPGFLTDLALHTGWRLESPKSGTHDSRTALILGAGGSARAVVYALMSLGWHIWVCARRQEQVEDLINHLERLSTRPFTYLPWDALSDLANTLPSPLDLLVNTTPLGMAPDVSASPWPLDVELPSTTFVYDLVYNPLETSLLRQAHVAGLPAANGLGMLVEQAALAFERWTGFSPSRESMKDALSSIPHRTSTP